MSATLEETRAALGDAAVYTLRRAAELLPGRDAENRRWLKRAGLVGKIDGREVVVWGDVLARLRTTEATAKPAQRPPAPAEGRRVKL